MADQHDPAPGAVSLFLYIVAACAAALSFALVLTGRAFNLFSLGFCAVTVGAPLVGATVLYVRAAQTEQLKRRAVHAAVIALFVFYLGGLSGMLFLSRIELFNYAAQRASYYERFELMTNFEPFDTIALYLRCLRRDIITGVSLTNLAGNVLLFMPMSFFLPALFVRLRSFWRFPLLMLLLLCAVEAVQLLLCCGSCDVDDVILNLAGAMAAFSLFMLPPVRRLLVRLYLFAPEPEKSKAAAPGAESG